MTAPPIIKIPPPAAKKGRINDFDRFINKHPVLRQYKVAIQQWAGEFGVPALWVAATLIFESAGQNSGLNKQGTGYGLAQINPKAWFGKTFPPTGEQITQQWASNPGNAIKFAAWYLSTGISTYGTLQGVYANVYNPGYKGAGPAALLKGYNVNAVGKTPIESATGAAARKQAANTLPVNEQSKVQRFLDPIYLAYTGHRATPNDVSQYIKAPVSTYQLELNLANPKLNPRLTKSPIWLTHAGTYESFYKDIFGPQAKVPQQAILFGLVHSMDERSFKQYLIDGKIPGQKAYETSENFKQQAATFQKSYANIYGLPDKIGQQAITKAVKQGWSIDQWENYLRKQPEYTQSGEYKQRSIELASRMGLVPGGVGQTALAGTPHGPVVNSVPPPQQRPPLVANNLPPEMRP